ncbi:NTP transferase domain-containing protein [Pararoseomonas indoligenes]|uniref:Phosphocholine cytidylyltransferase family protein n=1 Tax=Roseomonas indoligenes TaxID=2820811 RepID=A0A940MU44_9PROT|nr:phosphocholine cytidylyltransferase family protein [Pararoseomonas indoligenes]MBP0491723.1 phosphocholine cytidylyltransferase family protein [Pararoseomonas indoligenes]
MHVHAPAPTAIILAAGVGRRLGTAHDGPKILLEFGGRTLLHRHLDALAANGIRQVSMTVGYEHGLIEAEVARIGWADRVSFIENPHFRQGSLVSLAVQDAVLRAGNPVLLMDGDVLYDSRMIGALLDAPGENILLLDREIEPGDEPVKICFRDGTIVDFRKVPEHAHDRHGESVGFFRFSAETATALADRCRFHVAAEHTKLEYEEAIRDLILAEPARFQAHDITALPWVEIDFEEDILRARRDILPQLNAA